MGIIKFVKFSLQLPDHYERKLRLWAKVKGTPRASLAANILQNRIEVNWPDVEKQLDEIGQQKGVTRAELEAELLNGGDDDD